METTTQTLAEFVLERLSEDEASAREALAAASIYRQDTVKWHWLAAHSQGSRWHPTPFDPARALSECEAKRQIVEAHPSYGGYGERCATCYASDELTGDPWPCETLRALASVWADHPAYRPEWRP